MPQSRTLPVKSSLEAIGTEFGILGPHEVRSAGQVVPVGGAKSRALLGLLLVHASDVVSAERHG